MEISLDELNSVGRDNAKIYARFMVQILAQKSLSGSTQIGMMLHEINYRLSQVGYVPDTTIVLLDIDEQEKVHLVSRHSEKLAMAHELIKTASAFTKTLFV
ncbi:hypothetical protein MTR_5g006590 [Medicago truncatula]|uniref:DYW domain-containing protein n=1 Tax=Medicago truncatula TaxID=3880 RepID=G7K3Q5_MEDTR|nr:hypothetical protein MTR_5g006590 [Medicago truncatula]